MHSKIVGAAEGGALLKSRACRKRDRQAVREEQVAKRYYVSGIVQGVGYRFFVERLARRLGIAGYAKNLRDGRVEVYAVATAVLHADLRAELEKGPRAAVVEEVLELEAAIEPRFSDRFSIEFDL